MEVGEEREIWADVIGEIEKQVEERSEKEWATPALISVPDLKLDSQSAAEVNVSPGKANRATLSKKLQAAAGPVSHSPAKQDNTNGNPYWAQDSSGYWVYEFGKRAAEAIDNTIQQAITGLSVDDVDLSGFAESMTTAVSKHVATTLQAVTDASDGLQRRTTLLWWKETLFSPSIRVSYREIPPLEAAVLMAFDLHRHIPTFSPASVAAFLRETIIGLPTIDQKVEFPIRELVERTRTATNLAEFRAGVSNLVTAPEGGRGSILSLVGHPEIAGRADDGEFRNLVGVKPDTMLTLPDWSVWMFRELQAVRAIAEAAAPKRRASRRRTARK